VAFSGSFLRYSLDRFARLWRQAATGVLRDDSRGRFRTADSLTGRSFDFFAALGISGTASLVSPVDVTLAMYRAGIMTFLADLRGGGIACWGDRHPTPCREARPKTEGVVPGDDLLTRLSHEDICVKTYCRVLALIERSSGCER
jgi:hypothetical protein